jgi:hypothetical protein
VNEILILKSQNHHTKIRDPIGKIKEFLRWNREAYPVSEQQQTPPVTNGHEPMRPPRRKKALKRNSVAPSDRLDAKSMRVNDVENDDNRNGELEKNNREAASLHM